MEPQIISHGARCAFISFRMVKKSPLPVAPIEAKKSRQTLGMSMLDPGGLLPKKRPFLDSPTITKLAVLSASPRKGNIEPAEFRKAVFQAGHVVAREKISIRRIAVEVLVNHFDKKLARLGEDIAFQAVESGAAYQRLGICAQGGNELKVSRPAALATTKANDSTPTTHRACAID